MLVYKEILLDLDISYLHVFTYSERPNTCEVNFGVTFPLMSKIDVIGEDIHPSEIHVVI